MPRFVIRRRLLAGLVVSCVAAALTFDIKSVATLSSGQLLSTLQFLGRVLLIPGILVSMAVSRSIHDFSLWVASLSNLIFWLVACWIIGVLYYKLPKQP
jgi:hypothetical protein